MSERQLLRFIRSHRCAVQASVSDGGVPQAALVGIAVTDRLEIVFDTHRASRKAKNLQRNHRVCFVIGGWEPGEPVSVQYEGVAAEPMGAEREALLGYYGAQFPEGRRRHAGSDVILLHVRPRWARLSDFRMEPPSIVEFEF